jgi:hypothetical protein
VTAPFSDRLLETAAAPADVGAGHLADAGRCVPRLNIGARIRVPQ